MVKFLSLILVSGMLSACALVDESLNPTENENANKITTIREYLKEINTHTTEQSIVRLTMSPSGKYELLSISLTRNHSFDRIDISETAIECGTVEMMNKIQFILTPDGGGQEYVLDLNVSKFREFLVGTTEKTYYKEKIGYTPTLVVSTQTKCNLN